MTEMPEPDPEKDETSSPKMPSNPKIDFHHPYTPYSVQLDFMRTVYDVLEQGNGQVGILESPTGTVSNPLPQSHTRKTNKLIV
jgi:Rad3-related DNA helicase